MYKFAYNSIVIFSGISFIIYGYLIIFTSHMTIEFYRYGMSHLRTLTGFLELLAGFSLLYGHYYSKNLVLLVSACLALLMLIGIIVRIKVGDTLLQTMPAILFMLANIFIIIYQSVYLRL